MCGITGFCDFTKRSSAKELSAMRDALVHRGPDAKGQLIHELEVATIGLGHRRLSILDLSSGGVQPMIFENLELVYNGEVYNFQTIRDELESLGYTFHTQSDTEVLLKAYHAWGLKALDKFRGMFAMAIFDKGQETLILIRDRAGVKPLYWYFKDGLFLFASELKSFHEHPNFQKEIDQDVLAQYLQHGYVLQPYSIFKSTQQLEAGHTLKIDFAMQKIEKKSYWSVSKFYEKPKLTLTDEEAITQTESILKEAFNYRMVSDVPVGTFLSGGYDSSLVTALLQADRDTKINTFTIGFKEKGYDEAPHAKAVANHLGTNHTEYYCTHRDALEVIPKLAEIYDEPFGDASAIPTVLVSQLAREKVTVSLSADGGDEIFAGYGAYDNLLNLEKKFKKIPHGFKKMGISMLEMVNPSYIPFTDNLYNFEIRYEKIKKMLMAQNVAELLEQSYEQYSKSELNRLLLKKPHKLKTGFDIDVSNLENSLDQMLMVDYKTYMADDILTKVDRATMSVGLEGREPFLDAKIIEFAAQLPNEMKYRNGEKKWVLKEITHKYIPKSMMDRPKMGFSPPITEWFRVELKSYFLHYLSRERLEKEGLFNPDEVIRLRDAYLGGKNVSVQRLWSILMFEMWYERWM
jgi:asparagine synthase (glutamine-hydrolysing)